MTKKILLRIVALLMSVALFTGCGSVSESSRSQKDDEQDKIQIGMCFDSFVIERWKRDRDVFVSTAKELGAEVNIQNGCNRYYKY